MNTSPQLHCGLILELAIRVNNHLGAHRQTGFHPSAHAIAGLHADLFQMGVALFNDKHAGTQADWK